MTAIQMRYNRELRADVVFEIGMTMNHQSRSEQEEKHETTTAPSDCFSKIDGRNHAAIPMVRCSRTLESSPEDAPYFTSRCPGGNHSP
jgi:hypothetical protein